MKVFRIFLRSGGVVEIRAANAVSIEPGTVRFADDSDRVIAKFFMDSIAGYMELPK